MDDQIHYMEMRLLDRLNSIVEHKQNELVWMKGKPSQYICGDRVVVLRGDAKAWNCAEVVSSDLIEDDVFIPWLVEATDAYFHRKKNLKRRGVEPDRDFGQINVVSPECATFVEMHLGDGTGGILRRLMLVAKDIEDDISDETREAEEKRLAKEKAREEKRLAKEAERQARREARWQARERQDDPSGGDKQ